MRARLLIIALALVGGCVGAPPPPAARPGLEVSAADGRLETVAAGLSRLSGRTIVVAATQAPTPSGVGSATFTGATWLEVLDSVCAHADLGVERLDGGTLLLTRGPASGEVRRTEAILAAAGRTALHGPDAEVSDVDPSFRTLHWWRALRRFSAGLHVRGAGRLVALDREPFVWGEPLFDVGAAPPADPEGPRIAVRARRERVVDVVARIARRVGRPIALQDVDPRRVVSCDLPALPWRDALEAIARAFGLEVRATSDGGALLAARRTGPTLLARGLPLASWLTLLSDALGEQVRLEGAVGGIVDAEVIGVDVATLRSATLALWRCEATWAPDGALVVRQTRAVRDPLGAPAPSPELAARVEVILDEARRMDPSDEEQWDGLWELGDQLRDLLSEASPDDAAMARARVGPDEAGLDPVLLALFDGEAQAAEAELERARRCRDLPRAHRALVRLRQLAVDAPRRPDFDHLPVDIPAVADDWSTRLLAEAEDWELCPSGGVIDDDRGVRRAIVGDDLVSEGETLETGRGPALVREISSAGILYERGGEEDLVPYP